MDNKDIISEVEYHEYKQLIKSKKKLANEINIVIAVIFAITLIISVTLVKTLNIPWGFIGIGVEFILLIIVNIAIFIPLTKKIIAVELYEQELEKQQNELEKQLQAQQEQEILD